MEGILSCWGQLWRGRAEKQGEKSEEMVSSAVWALERIGEGRRGNRGPMPGLLIPYSLHLWEKCWKGLNGARVHFQRGSVGEEAESSAVKQHLRGVEAARRGKHVSLGDLGRQLILQLSLAVVPLLLPEAFPQSTGADFKGNSPALPSSWPAERCWGPGWRTAGPLDPVEEKGWEFFFGQNCRE